MLQSYYTSQNDRVGWHDLSWKMYLTCLLISFFVMVEPAPTDLIFVLTIPPLLLAGFHSVRIFRPVEIVGIWLFLWFSTLSLYFADFNFVIGLRAYLIELYMLLLFVVTAYFVRCHGDFAFYRILLMLTLGGVAASTIGILAWLDVIPNSEIFFRDEYKVRVKSTFKDPNVLGPYLIPGVLLTFWVMISNPKFRILNAGLCALLAVGVFITFSRGAWVHLVLTAACFFLALLKDKKTTLPATIFAIALLGMCLPALVVFLESSADAVSGSYFQKRLTLQSYDDSRFEHVISAFFKIADHPFGIGPNQVGLAYGYVPHNTFIVFALHNGIFACLGFCILYFGAIYRCLQKVLAQNPGWIKYAFVLSILVGLFVLMNVVGSIHWRHLFVVMGLAYGTYSDNEPFPHRSAT